MKFHRIRLRDYRAIPALEFEPGETGITIVQGDNETGKSTITEALWLIFEQHDDSASAVVRAIRPVGRDVGTEIEVEASSGPYRFTFFKRFFRGARTELRITQPAHEVLTGREADARAKEILAETIDVALWKALRLQQGAADNLEPLAAGHHQSLLSALDEAASEALGGDREKSLYERARLEYERYFTASGREKSGGDALTVGKLRHARDVAQADSARLEQRIASIEARVQRAADLDEAAAELDLRRQAAAAAHAAVAQRHEARRARAAEVESLTANLRVCEAAVREAQAALEARRTDATALEPRKQELVVLHERMAEAEQRRSGAAEALDAARAVVATAEAAVTAARAADAAAEQALHLAGDEFTAQTMAERLERLERNEPDLSAITGWLAACKLDARAAQQIRQADERLGKLQARREAEGATIEVAAPDGLDFEVNGRPARVEPGRVVRGSILGESRISLPGNITITVRAGTAARELEAQVAEAKSELDRLLAASGVASAAAADELLKERIANETRRRGLEEQLRADLRDLSSVEELRRKLARERARIDGLRAAGDIPSIEAAKASREGAARSLAASEEADRTARAEMEQQGAALTAAERELSGLAVRAASLEEEIARTMARLDAARANRSDDELANAFAAAQANEQAAAEALATAQASLDGLPDFSTDLEDARRALAVLEQEGARLADERASIRGVLEDAGASGLHAQLAEAESAVAAADDELAAFERRANAARTLFETLSRHREAAKDRYRAPLQSRIESLGKLVFGDDFTVELSDDLRIARRTQRGVTLDISQLSTGVREQLSVLTRLACASLVGPDGGAPLVLDDIFGWADPGRLRKLGPVLAAAAAGTQVLLFTCTPERFASVAPARVVSIPSGASYERVAPEEAAALHEPPSQPPGLASRRPAPAAPRLTPQATFDLFAEPAPASPSKN